MFQFQNGTIKSFSHKSLSHPISLFQFQNGTIKSLSSLVFDLIVWIVSIPKWYD